MEVTLGVLSDYASVSQEGKLNIMGVFGEVNPSVLPVVLASMYVVLSFEASPAEYDLDKVIKVVLLNADGGQIMAMEQPIKVPRPARPGSPVLMNDILGLNGVRFERAGDYAFSVLINNDHKKTIAFRVNEPMQGGQNV